jgi:hypothetical protein
MMLFAIASLAITCLAVTGLIPVAAAEEPADTAGQQMMGSDWQGMMGPGMGGGMMGGGMMGRGMEGMMGPGGCPMMGSMMGQGGMMGGGDVPMYREGRIAFLKAELAITEAQTKAWDAYAEALKKNMQSMQDMRKAMMAGSAQTSPVERLDARISAMDGRLQALKDIKPALAALYGALSDDQKKKADQLLTGMGCMM